MKTPRAIEVLNVPSFWRVGEKLYRRVPFRYGRTLGSHGFLIIVCDMKTNRSFREVYTIDAHGVETFKGYINTTHGEHVHVENKALRQAAHAAYEAL